MIRRFLFLLITVVVAVSMPAQTNSLPAVGKIALIPYISKSYGSQVDALLTNKLQQIATIGGMSGAGFDDRFIITARLLANDKQQTATIPQKTALRLSVTLYIGDGHDGTLYSSWETELRGIGNSDTQAYLSALRKLSVNNSDLQAFVERGKQRIVTYYNSASKDIMASAKALAVAGKHNQAVIKLLAIPSTSNAYEQAQELIAQYGMRAVENYNQELLGKAQAAWGANPDENGASVARRYLAQISYPSATISNKMQQLSNQMATRLGKISDQQWRLLMQESKQWHERQMSRIEGYNEREKARIESDRDQKVATILGIAQVEAARASRPIVKYTINHWW
jgi:hypothetical protein